MITRTVEYTDYDGNKRKEKLFFNLTQFEATEIATEMPEGIIEDIADEDAGDNKAIAIHLVEKLGSNGVLKFIKNIVLRSYGVKSPDGRRFIKSEEISTEFSQTPAFSEFMMQLMTDDEAASSFINGVIPAELAAKINSGNKVMAIEDHK